MKKKKKIASYLLYSRLELEILEITPLSSSDFWPSVSHPENVIARLSPWVWDPSDNYIRMRYLLTSKDLIWSKTGTFISVSIALFEISFQLSCKGKKIIWTVFLGTGLGMRERERERDRLALSVNEMKNAKKTINIIMIRVLFVSNDNP